MIFNTLFSEKANPFRNGTEADELIAPLYEDYIVDYYERQGLMVLVGMWKDLDKSGMDEHAFSLEVDLYNHGTPNGTSCFAVYNLIINPKLPKSSQKKVREIFEEQIAGFPETKDLLTPFIEIANSARANFYSDESMTVVTDEPAVPLSQ